MSAKYMSLTDDKLFRGRYEGFDVRTGKDGSDYTVFTFFDFDSVALVALGGKFFNENSDLLKEGKWYHIQYLGTIGEYNQKDYRLTLLSPELQEFFNGEAEKKLDEETPF